MAAGRVAGHPLIADQLAGVHDVADPDDDLAEMGIDAAIAVAIIDHDREWQVIPHRLAVEERVVPAQVTDPADVVVEMTAGRQDDAVVSGADPISTEGRKVDSVVPQQAVL